MLTEPSSTYRPFLYPWAVEARMLSERAHWGEWEAELQEDVNQWRTKLSDAERSHITQILRLFTHSDFLVAGNYLNVLIPKFENNEVRGMLSSFAAREFTHQFAYALLNDTLGLDESEYWAFKEHAEMRAKADFMSAQQPDSPRGLALSLAQAVCNEGMSLFSAFAMLLNYQRFGKMSGMCTVVEWSIKDETLHVNSLATLFLEYCRENPSVVSDRLKRDIYEMYRKAVALEDDVIDLAFANGPIEGLSAEDMKSYVRFIADRRLIQLGMKPNYNVTTNPLPWLDWLVSGDSLSNFFEKRVTDYSKNSLSGDWDWDIE